MNRTRLKERIRDLVENRKNVRHESVVNFLENHIHTLCIDESLPYDCRVRGSHYVFTIGSRTFTFVKPHGTPFVKPVYVRSFLEAMEALDLYEER